MILAPGESGVGSKQQDEARLTSKGMHPYTYGSNSGVAFGNQAIDQMGNPTAPRGLHRWHSGQSGQPYGYGQPRY